MNRQRKGDVHVKILVDSGKMGQNWELARVCISSVSFLHLCFAEESERALTSTPGISLNSSDYRHSSSCKKKDRRSA